jgi:catechol 2,3-dioxygenase-like lactoylglutathione lyase family enzyme
MAGSRIPEPNLGRIWLGGSTRACSRQAARCARMWRIMDQRVSLITLGVVDLARARAFYEELGWRTKAEPDDDVVFFQTGGLIVALWDREKLAEDSGVKDGGGAWGGVTLAYNVGSPEAVDAVLAEAGAAGATIARPGAETFWGGYSGVFIDPDGHPWEVAHNPHWTLHDDGSVTLTAA